MIPLARRAERLLLRLSSQLWQQRRHNRLALEQVAGYELVILPEVMNPRIFRSGEYFSSVLSDNLIAPHSHVLDMGSGSGIVALVAARWASRVLAVDINPAAVRCTGINVLLNGLEERVEVRESDLFSAVQRERFDLVLFNPPYFRGQAQPGFEQAWRSEDTVERFATQLRDYLKPNGSALLVLSTDGDAAAFLRVFAEQGYCHNTIASRRLLAETLTVHHFWLHGKE